MSTRMMMTGTRVRDDPECEIATIHGGDELDILAFALIESGDLLAVRRLCRSGFAAGAARPPLLRLRSEH
jgi:hypothetical protein